MHLYTELLLKRAYKTIDNNNKIIDDNFIPDIKRKIGRAVV